MRIYVAHSKDFDYVNELYKPIRECELSTEHEFLLPHEENANSSNAREFYNNIDILIAEVSFPATGLGIELGWAYDDKTPVYCLYKKGKKYSGSVRSVTGDIYEYSCAEEMISIIKDIINKEQKNRVGRLLNRMLQD